MKVGRQFGGVVVESRAEVDADVEVEVKETDVEVKEAEVLVMGMMEEDGVNGALLEVFADTLDDVLDRMLNVALYSLVQVWFHAV